MIKNQNTLYRKDTLNSYKFPPKNFNDSNQIYSDQFMNPDRQFSGQVEFPVTKPVSSNMVSNVGSAFPGSTLTLNPSARSNTHNPTGIIVYN
jgi:hypothetical protein